MKLRIPHRLQFLFICLLVFVLLSPLPASSHSAATPDTIAGGPTLWLKTSNLELNDGDPVVTWEDVSGNGYNVTQATGANQPTYQTSYIGEQPAVLFDGEGDYLSTTSFVNLAGSEFTIFLVARTTTVPPNNLPANWFGNMLNMADQLGASRTNSVTLFHKTIGITSPQGFARFRVRTSLGEIEEDPAELLQDATNAIFSYQHTAASGIDLYRDGTQDDNFPVSTSGNLISSSTTTLVLGINAILSSNSSWPGALSEVLIYNSALSASQREQIEMYLSSTYSISIPAHSDSGTPTVTNDLLGPLNFWINGGEKITSSRNVLLTFDVKNATEMILSENPDFYDTSWEPYKKEKPFTLSSGDGNKVIYAYFKSQQNTSPIVATYITLKESNLIIAFLGLIHLFLASLLLTWVGSETKTGRRVCRYCLKKWHKKEHNS